MSDIILEGYITSETFKEVFEQINQCSDILNLFICSEGGDFESALAIIDAMRCFSPVKKVRTVAMGKAFSGAAFIFAMGEERVITPNASVMFHPVQYEVDNNYHNDVVNMLHHAETIYKNAISMITDHCGLEQGIVEALFENQELWLTAEDCLLNNIATKIQSCNFTAEIR